MVITNDALPYLAHQLTVSSIEFIRQRLMCGSLVAQTLKMCNGHNQFILVRASEPYVQQYGILCVRNAQSGFIIEELRESLAGDCAVLS